jgi:cobalt transporter subunit CbtA
MFSRIVRTALLAGALAGLFAWVLQMAKTTPLILKAEVYEEMAEKAKAEASANKTAPSAASAAAHTRHDASAKEWEPEGGFERNAYTLLSSLITAIGFAFMLTGAVALSGRVIDWQQGIIWGLAAYAAFYVSPSLGLPPEVPGIDAAPLGHRQIWWLATAVATALALALIFFAPKLGWRVVAVVLIVVPHVIGAPAHAPEPGPLPAALAAEFAVTSLVTVGLFWMALGGLTGYFYRRFDTAR